MWEEVDRTFELEPPQTQILATPLLLVLGEPTKHCGILLVLGEPTKFWVGNPLSTGEPF